MRQQTHLFDPFVGARFERTAPTEELQVMPKKASPRWVVLSVIAKVPKRGVIINEILTPLTADEVALSLLELLDGGFIQESGKRPNDEGELVPIWRVTDYGIQQWKERKR